MSAVQSACPGDAASPRHSREAVFDGRTLLRVAVVCVAYYVAVVGVLKLQLGFSQIQILWPAGAVLAAALVLSPKRHWWWYLLAVIPVHIAGYAGRPGGPGWSLAQILYNSMVSIVTATIIRRFAPKTPTFARVREVAA